MREQLIYALEQLPVVYCHFYERWQRIHDVDVYACWSDSRFDPTLACWPRDICLLIAAEAGKADVDNGGFHQFFGNPDGVAAPEMLEWCERSGLHEVADVMAEAISFFGNDFPRSQDIRRARLPFDEDQPRDVWDPFVELDSRFYGCCTNEVFNRAANEWLQDVCGITNLRQVTCL